MSSLKGLTTSTKYDDGIISILEIWGPTNILQYPLNGNLNIRLGNLSLWLKFPVYATTGDPLSLIRTDSDLLRGFFLLNF